MAEKALYYPWFPRDFLADEVVLPMSLAEEGAYRRLLDHQWLHGSIPADLDAQRGICKNVTPREMKKIWARVSICFVEMSDDPSRLYNRRLQRQREEVQRVSEKMSKKGKDGAAKRWAAHGAGNGAGKAEPSQENSAGMVLAMPGDSNTKLKTTPPARAREVGGALREKLSEPHNVAAVERFLTAAPTDQRASALEGTLLTWLSGHDWPPGPKLTPNAAASGLTEYLDADEMGDFNTPHVRAFLLRTVRQWHKHSDQLASGAAQVPAVAQQEAQAIWGEVKRSGVLYASNTEEWQEMVKAIADTEAVKSVEHFTGIWRELDKPFLRAASTERAAVAHIGEALSRVQAAA